VDEEKDWYGNKELYEMIQGLKDDLQETRTAVQRYNGLRQDLADTMKRIAAMEEQKTGRGQVWEGIRLWIPWAIALLTLFARLKEWI
jgi:hypothetical protein